MTIKYDCTPFKGMSPIVALFKGEDNSPRFKGEFLDLCDSLHSKTNEVPIPENSPSTCTGICLTLVENYAKKNRIRNWMHLF